MAEHHDHDHDHSELSETELRVRALETILTEKGYIEPAALDAIIQAYETRIGPHNGARVVAKAWTDPDFKQALLEDASKAVGTLSPTCRRYADGAMRCLLISLISKANSVRTWAYGFLS